MLNAIPVGEVLAPGTRHDGSGVTEKNKAATGPSIEANSPITTSRRLTAEGLDPGSLVDPGVRVSGEPPDTVSAMGDWLTKSEAATRAALETFKAAAARAWGQHPATGGDGTTRLVPTVPNTTDRKPTAAARDSALARGTASAAAARASAEAIEARNKAASDFWAVRA